MNTGEHANTALKNITDEVLKRNMAASTMCHVIYDARYGEGAYRKLLLRIFNSEEDSDISRYNDILQMTNDISDKLCQNKKETVDDFLKKYSSISGEAKKLYDNIVSYKETNNI